MESMSWGAAMRLTVPLLLRMGVVSVVMAPVGAMFCFLRPDEAVHLDHQRGAPCTVPALCEKEATRFPRWPS